MVELLGIPVENRVKIMTAMLVRGMTAEVDHNLDRTTGAELREFASHCLRLLADAKAGSNV